MFPLWGNGSGTWLRSLIIQMNAQFPDFKAGIVAPESRMFKDARMFRLKPPQMGVFVGNPELKDIKNTLNSRLKSLSHFIIIIY